MPAIPRHDSFRFRILAVLVLPLALPWLHSVNGLLNVGETWSWRVDEVAVSSTPEFMPIGHGTDVLRNEISYSAGSPPQPPALSVDHNDT